MEDGQKELWRVPEYCNAADEGRSGHTGVSVVKKP